MILRLRPLLVLVLLSVATLSGGGSQTAGSDTVRIGVLRNGTYEVVTLSMDDYVARVLAGEAAPDSAPAALEALAIAIRTYTITNLGRHRAEGFDLCDQTHCQVMRTATAATTRAAAATSGRMLLYNGRPATVYYSASCGGRSEKPSNVWPGADDPPYLGIHDDDGCGGFPMWSSELAAADLQRALTAAGYKGTLRGLRVLARNESGRVARIALDGMTPREITGQDLRMVVGRTLGFQHIQSTAFELRSSGRAFRFTGHGAGHGVGLCVIGSMKLAAAGQSAAAILSRYFPGTVIGPVVPRLTAAPASPSPDASPAASPVAAAAESPTSAPAAPPSAGGSSPSLASAGAAPAAAGAAAAGRVSAASPTGSVTVTVPQEDAEARGSLVQLVSRERAAIAQALGVEAPRVQVRAHDTVQAYEQASGRPAFTLSAVAHEQIELAPLWLLRERGMLERSIRRALAKMMVSGALPDKPAWLREGAAVYFADPKTLNSARPPCPQDAELQQPTSVGAWGDALARARACFEARIRGDRDWKTIR